MRAAAWSLVLIATACVPERDPEIAGATEAIIGGTPTTGYAGVVALTDEAGVPFCTGTLVAPHVVLTAAHCILRDGVLVLPHGLFAGSNPVQGGVFHRVRSAEPHPDYDPYFHTADLALLRTDGEVAADATPPADPVPDPLGLRVRLVGFGATEAGVSGGKQTVITEIVASDADSVRYLDGSCFGDSGGPVLLAGEDGEERLLGVISTGSLVCTSARAVLLAPHEDWLAERIDVLESCPADEECRGDASCQVQAIGGPPAPIRSLWLLAVLLVARCRRVNPQPRSTNRQQGDRS